MNRRRDKDEKKQQRRAVKVNDGSGPPIEAMDPRGSGAGATRGRRIGRCGPFRDVGGPAYFLKQNTSPLREPMTSRSPEIAGEATTRPPSVNFHSSAPSA